MNSAGPAFAILALYFAPFLVALIRRHSKTVPIFLLTLLLGWTGLGWIIALIWSAMPQERRAAAKDA